MDRETLLPGHGLFLLYLELAILVDLVFNRTNSLIKHPLLLMNDAYKLSYFTKTGSLGLELSLSGKL